MTEGAWKAGLSQLPELRALHRSVAWFYARAIAVAARRGERGEGSVPPVVDLAKALELARGCRRVLVAGATCSFTAAAMALDDEARQVLAFRGDGWPETEPYVGMLPDRARSRVELIAGPAERLPTRVPLRVCLLALDGDPGGGLNTLLALVDVVQPGALVVLRESERSQQSWVTEALREIGLGHGHGTGAFMVWRKPVAEPPSPTPAATSRRSSKRVVAAAAAALAAAGLAIGVAVLAGGGDAGPAKTVTPAVLPAQAVPSPPRSRRDRARSRGSTGSAKARSTASGGASAMPDAAGGKAGRSKAGGTTNRATRQSFSGQGSVQLGTLVVRRPSVLTWKSTAGGVSIASDALVLSSPASSGRTELSPGRYAHFTVKAPGIWTVRIRPR